MINDYLLALQPLMKYETAKGQKIEVDDRDTDLLIYLWNESSDKGYASKWINATFYYLHRVIAERMISRCLDKGEVVDHIDGNVRNNRRSNLRVTTDGLNKVNSRDLNRSGQYRGVYRDERGRNKQYMAYITKDGKRKTIGYFMTPEEAARARDEAAKSNFGEFARLNNV